MSSEFERLVERLEKLETRMQLAEESSFGGRKNYVCLAVWNREAPTY
jgi:hypothetical protein